MVGVVIGVFLIAHGLVHAGLFAAPDPNDPESSPGAFFTSTARSWFFNRIETVAVTVQRTGIILAVLSTLGFVIAGVGILGVPAVSEIWQAMSVISAAVSLLLLIIFWHPWLVVGVLIDLLVFLSVLFLHWPSELFNGA
jgi:hypothetical protein